VTTLTPNERKSLLQRGIAAARSGRSAEALNILEQVVKMEPENEMAWLWLSGLMRSNEQKRACLENVLRANPENVYARAGLMRLQDTVPMAPDEMEARLAFAVGANSPPASAPGSFQEMPSVQRQPLKRLKPPRSANQRRNGDPKTATNGPAVDAVDPGSEPDAESVEASVPNSLDPTCPACDEPISPTAKMCPYCYMPLRSMDELLDLDPQNQDSDTPHSSRRGRILGNLGSVISV
jgi:tetratricopeptide (TPR) repeat protein